VRPKRKRAPARTLRRRPCARGAGAPWSGRRLSQSFIELHLSAPSPVRVGEAVDIEVALRNASARPVWIVGVVPGSEGGLRLPRYLPRVIADGTVVAAPARSRAARLPPLRLRDFRLLASGESVDPTQGGVEHGWTRLQTFLSFRPRRPGRYVFVLTLSMQSDSPEQWLTEVDLADDRDELLARIGHVPRLVAESNRLEVKVA